MLKHLLIKILQCKHKEKKIYKHPRRLKLAKQKKEIIASLDLQTSGKHLRQNHQRIILNADGKKL